MTSLGISAGKNGLEFGTKHFGPLEGAFRGEVVVVEAVLRARNAPGDRIDGLLLAAVARRRARIEQRRALEFLLHDGKARVHRGLRLARIGAGRNGGTSAVTGRPSRCHFARPPSSTATCSWPTQRSIHHRRDGHRAGAAVVADHRVGRLQALPAEPGDEGFRLRQRVAAVAAGLRRRRGRGRGARTARRECAPPAYCCSPSAGLARSWRQSKIRHSRVLRQFFGRDQCVQVPISSSRRSHSWKCTIVSSIGDW